jgi:hypothetical protein
MLKYNWGNAWKKIFLTTVIKLIIFKTQTMHINEEESKYLKTKRKAAGVMVYACNLRIWEAKEGGFEFEASWAT